MSKQVNVTEMSLSEMVVAYNKMADQLGMKNVAKFADRKSAERRVLEIAALIPEVKPAKAKKSTGRSISEGVRESWKVNEVAVKRLTKNGVMVDGFMYSCVREAFQVLGLPMEKHIKFRVQLKAARVMVAFGRTWVMTI